MSAEPIPLVTQGTDKIVAFACGKCRIVASSPKQFVADDAVEVARDAARTHCGPWLCECGTERRQWASLCDACDRESRVKAEAERDAALVAKAKRVALADYDVEMVCVNTDDYLTIDDLHTRLADGEISGPVWGCRAAGLKLDAGDVIEHALENGEHHEDAHEWLASGAQKALQEALDAWRDKYASGVRSFFPDYGTLVVCDAVERKDEASA